MGYIGDKADKEFLLCENANLKGKHSIGSHRPFS